MKSRIASILVALSLQASLLVPAAGAVEALGPQKSVSTMHDNTKVRLYFQSYPLSNKQFAEDQLRVASDILEEFASCEIVSSAEVLKAVGGTIPSYFDMEQNKWALAVKTGKVLHADYVLVSNLFSELGAMNLDVSLVNVRTGTVFFASNSGSSEGAQSANPAGMAQRLSRATFMEIVRKARKDILATASKTREDYVKDTAPPTILITSPETSGGKVTMSSPVLRVAGRVRDDSGVQGVFINEKEAALSSDGSFSAELVLSVGMNDVIVTALDSEGNKSTQTLKVTRQSQRATNKVQIYIQPYPTSDRHFLEEQVGIAAEALSELNSCEIVSNKDALAVLGGRIPTPFEMEQNKWALAIRTGKTLEADYVLIGYRSMDIGTMNFTATLINVNTGTVFSVSNSGSSEGAQSANLAAMIQRLSKSAYDEIVRKANKDLVATASRKRDTPPMAAVKKSAPATIAPVAPTISITAPNITRGVKIVGTQKLLVAGTVTTDRGISAVYVNDEKTNTDASGKFSLEIPLKTGANEVTVVAVDSAGTRAAKTFTVTGQQLAKASAPEKNRLAAAPRAGEYYALIIGNNDYKYLPKLATARKDAVAIEKVLKENYGFTTKLLLDASRNEILDVVNNFRRSLGEMDSFLIYYAGHGEFDKKGDKAYWLPIDAQRDNDTNWIISDDLTTNMKRISARHVLVIADSCFSGAMTRNFTADLIAKGRREDFIAKMSRKMSRTLLASGGNEPVSDGGGSDHSVFADTLLTALREIDHRTFTAEELFHGFVKEQVAGRSEQTPEYNTIRNSGHDGGDFVFEKR